MNWPIAIGLNAYQGYALDEVFKSFEGIGFNYVDLDYIKTSLSVHDDYGLTHLTEKDLQHPDDYRSLMDRFHLKIATFSGHVDLTIEEDVELFLKKMDFAQKIGARYISTNEGSLRRRKEFMNHLELVEKKARELGIIVCLETEMPGDMITKGEDGIPILTNMASPFLMMTYDTGNIYYSHQGNIDIVEDFDKSIDYVGTLHFKNPYFKNGVYQYGEIGLGEIDFPGLAKILKSSGRIIPITIEIPYFFESANWGPLSVKRDIIPLQEINELMMSSLDYIQGILKD